jgi:DNA-binding CsgD family transcriptional regulator
LLARLARDQGEPELAWRLIHEQLPAGSATPPGDAILLDTLALLRLAARLTIDDGDTSSSRAWLEAHDRWLDWSQAVLGRAEGHLAWAAFYRASGDLAAAARQTQSAITCASQPRQPLVLLVARRVQAELAMSERRFDAAAACLADALTLAEACAAPYERAAVLLALAELHGLRGNRSEANRLLDEVQSLAEPLGAAPLLARADVLRARVSVARLAGLSEREVEVLRLVAQGLTDAQVAARLTLSTRTVSQHLRSIYNKLSVNTRSAATRIAVERGLA